MTAKDRYDEIVALLRRISEESVTTSNVLTDVFDLLRDRLSEPDEPAPADDLPGEPVEPGDLRAGHRVAFTWMQSDERITCTLVSTHSPVGYLLRSDTPGPRGYLPPVVSSGEWCHGISDVRLIERAPREDEDPDEALATGGASTATRLAVDAARRNYEMAQERRIRAEKAEAERDDWKAKHAALREDVEGMRERWLHDGAMLTHFDRVLRRDDERTPLADPDTVTLRRDDVEDILATARVCGVTEDRVREALADAMHPPLPRDPQETR